MNPILKKLAGICFLMLLLPAVINKVKAQTGPGIILKNVLDGAKGQLAKDSSVTVQDSAYLDDERRNELDTPYSVRNIVTLKINEYSTLYLGAPFSATAHIRITYTTPGLEEETIEQDLVINYDTANTYAMRSSFVFANAHKVKVEILDLSTNTTANVLPALMLENEIMLHPVYKWSCTENAVEGFHPVTTPVTDSTDELQVSWDVATGADVYDLEWAYVDSSALERYGNPVNADLLFAYNTTRVTVAGNSYRIPLLYDDGGILYYRVRAVQEKRNNGRMESVWSTYFGGGLGAYSFVGHQRLLNWQSSVAYAEDGKRKVTVQYFDGSLRSRQTVTKDNTTDTTIVAETAYDYQGRPVIQVLPAPTLSNVIKFTRNLNKDINGAEYDKDHYDYIASPEDYLTASAAPMDTASGANRYYSSLNPDKNNGLNKYISKAEGYAFTETQYTQDNTGRIAKQGGVGAGFKIGSNHETKYFYGAAAQEDLYALFGTEAGETSHYFKNMVADANGQYAVTYLDMHGRTVATALLGSPENTSLSDLPNKETRVVTDSLSGPGKNTVRDLVMESKHTLLVGEDSTYHFIYILPKPVLRKPDCDGNIVCYAGLYDLEIKITDDVYNLHLPGKQPFIKSFHNYSGGDILVDCNPVPDTIKFDLYLKKGSYEITKALSVNREGMDYYRDSLFLSTNVCTSLEEEIEKQKVLQRTVGCYPDCASCKTNLGSWDEFRVRYVLNAGNNIEDTALFRDEALLAYQQAMEACKALCNEVSEADDIRILMLQDVSAPSGQYANPAMDSLNTYSIFYKANADATPKYRQDDIVYLDETGNPDMVYDDMAGIYVKPQQLSQEQFAAMFKPSWAEALLKFHPEYCKLTEYEKYAASNLWDRRMEKIDSYQQAKDSGYLNPAGNISLFPANNTDPILNQLPAAQRQSLIDKLNAYVQYQDPFASYSMWSVAMISTKCGKADQDRGCADHYNTTEKAFDEGSLCAGDLDMAWRAFRQSYQREKRLVLESLMPGFCASEKALTDAGKMPRFYTTAGAYENSGIGEIPTDVKLAESYAQSQLQQLIYANCHSYVEYWVHQLAPCYGESVVRDELVYELEQVCREGGDLDHPRGASTVRPGSINRYRSFEEVIAEFNKTHSHPADPYLCNAELLAIPQPYDKQTAYVDNISYSKPTDCECNNLASLRREYQALKIPQDTTFAAYLFRTRHVKVAQSNLDALLDACTASAGSCTWLPKPLTIPAFMQCNVAPPCATCEEVQSVYSAFTSAYPGVTPVMGDVDSTQQLKNELFANYMNNHLGFSKQAWEYKSFLDSCEHAPVYPNVQVCKPADPGAKAYSYDNGGTSVITDIHRTRDNGYILAGSTTGYSHGGKDAYVIKTDSRGEVVWSKTYGAEQDDEFTRIAPTRDGGYVGIGSTYSYCYDQGAMLIIKLDADGTIVWNKAAEFAGHGGKGTDIIETRDYDLAFAGLSTLNGIGTEWIVGVLSPEGEARWTKQISSPGEKKGISLMENPLFWDEHATELLAATSVKAENDYNVVLISLDKNEGYNTRNSYWYDMGQQDNIAVGISPGIGFDVKVAVENAPGTTAASITAVNIELLEYSMQRPNKINLPGSLVGQTTGIFGTSDRGSYVTQTVANPTQDIYWHKLDEENRVQWSNHININGNERLHRILVNADGTLAGAGVYNNRDALLMLAPASSRIGCDSAVAGLSQESPYSSSWYLEVPIDTLLGTDCFSTVVIGETACNLTKTLVSCPPADSCYNVRAGLLLCGNAQAVFSPAAPNESSACSDSTYFATSAGTVIYNAYIDSVKNDFEESYKASVLQAKDMEKFAVTYASSEYHYTLYYYDQAGNLVKTIPPAGVVKDRSAEWIDQVKAAKAEGRQLVPAHKMITDYRYNTLNQVVAQKTPDAGKSRFWYDRLGRLVVSQNARQILTKAYSYTIYDVLGRITEVGEISSNTSMTDAISRDETGLANWINGAAATKKEITRTVYDLPYEAFEGMELLTASNLRNRVSWTAVYNDAANLDTNGYAAATFYSYDIHGNVDTLLQDFKQGTMRDKGNRWKKIVYNYDLVSGKVNMVAYQPGQKDAFYHRYSYDAENRITNVETSHDSVYWENDAFYQYYKHGPLGRMVLGQQQVQGLDYAYTLQGWLKGVNSTSLTAGSDMGGDGANGGITARDAFGFSLNYYGDNDYKPISATVKPFASVTPSGTAFRPLYNGNIAAMSVNIPKVGVPLLYQYGYDALNRIVSMDAQHGLDAATNTWTPVTVSDFAERVAYDPNGNILKYKRNGNNTWAGKPEFMDSLTYHYEPGRNRLNFIRDTVDAGEYDVDLDSQSPDNYTYDSIGNMVKDAAANIRSIEWTVYGKIRRIIRENGDTISYTYDPAGNRISKRVKGVETWYVRDASGNVMSVYVKGDNAINNGALSQTEIHLYGSSRLGISTRVTNVEDTTAPEPVNLDGVGDGANINFKRGYKFFELGNHLGNVLATVSDRKKAVAPDGNAVEHYEADVASAQDYYPFGMMQPGRNVRNGEYRYGFNGKENDNAVEGDGNILDFGARIYNSRAGRFLSTDPLENKFPEESPYGFAGNNPASLIDYHGMFKISPFFAKRYPTLAKIIKYYLPMLKDNPGVRDAWIKASYYTNAEEGGKAFDKMVTYGEGPYISPTRRLSEARNEKDLDLVGKVFYGQEGGEFAETVFPDNLLIGHEQVEKLEAAFKNGDEHSIVETMFTLTVAIMHESAHYGRFNNGKQRDDDYNIEAGAQFEQFAFGTRFSYRHPQVADAQLQRRNLDVLKATLTELKGSPLTFGLTPTPDYYNYFNSVKEAPVPKGQPGDKTVTGNFDKEVP
jgi:RHS repeat-associated protein